MSPKGVIFLKILIYEFFGFFGNLFLFLRILIPLKIGKKGFIFRKNCGLTWRGEGPARMRHGMQGHVAVPRGLIGSKSSCF